MLFRVGTCGTFTATVRGELKGDRQGQCAPHLGKLGREEPRGPRGHPLLKVRAHPGTGPETFPYIPELSGASSVLSPRSVGKTESDEDWRGADCCGDRLGLEETGRVCEVSFKKERKEAEPRVWAARGGRGWPGV